MAVLKVLLVVALIAGAAIAMDADADVDVERPPRAGKKLVSPRMLEPKHFMPKHRVVYVPKGDPRARPPVSAAAAATTPVTAPATASSSTVLKATASTCAGRGGSCIARASCTGTSTVVTGLCPGATYCCVPAAAAPSTPAPAVDVGSCPVYGGLATTQKAGNGGVMYATVPIAAQHLVDTSKLGLSDTMADNTMRLQPTACAFARMAEAAAKDGVILKIASGFRSYARQKYFYDCYLTKKCNGGNLAAKPGSSNHGQGIALDLNTDCGKQPSGKRPAPAACKSSKVYMWLLNNARTYGFIRAVAIEPWHWEYHAGAAMPSYALF